MNRDIRIDMIKGLSIISVILLHAFTAEQLMIIGAPFHIGHSVPIFMLIMGYNTSNSFINKKRAKFDEVYNLKYLYKRFSRIMPPYIVYFIVYAILSVIINSVDSNPFLLLKLFLVGSNGLGGYFIPLTIQAVFLIPIIFWTSYRYSSHLTLIFGLVINLTFELAVNSFNMDNEIFRLIILRYLFVITLGVWISFNKDIVVRKKYNALYALLGILGCVYIYLVMYQDVNFYINHPSWLIQNSLGYIYSFVLVVVLVKSLPSETTSKLLSFFQAMGERSYHIFITQMLYFWVERILDLNVPVVIDLIVTISIGWVFYEMDRGIKMKVRKHEVKI